MACTADEDSVGYLNDIDERFRAVDVTDDYYSEMLEVTKKARTKKQFTRGDWLMKAMLGPISNKFDAWDETGKKQVQLWKRCPCLIFCVEYLDLVRVSRRAVLKGEWDLIGLDFEIKKALKA